MVRNSVEFVQCPVGCQLHKGWGSRALILLASWSTIDCLLYSSPLVSSVCRSMDCIFAKHSLPWMSRTLQTMSWSTCSTSWLTTWRSTWTITGVQTKLWYSTWQPGYLPDDREHLHKGSQGNGRGKNVSSMEEHCTPTPPSRSTIKEEEKMDVSSMEELPNFFF